VARELAILREHQATGGSTTTVVDTQHLTEADDFWNGGTIWITKDAGGASAAPEAQFAEVSDFDNGTATATLYVGYTAAVAVGDYYAIADKRFPLDVLITQVNNAIQDMGRIPVTDTSSITIAANQTEYSLPAACRPDALREVWIQRQDSDSDDNQWEEILNWEIEVETTGTAPTLILPYQYATGYDLKLVYMGLHPTLFGYSDKLSEAVPRERIIYQAAYLALEWWKMRYKQDLYDQRLERMFQKAQEMKQMYMIKAPRKPGKIVQAKSRVSYSNLSEPNKVYLWE